MTPQEKFHIEYAIMTQLSKKGWAEKNIYELIQQVMDGVGTESSVVLECSQQSDSLNTTETRGEFLLNAFPKTIIRGRTLSHDPSKCNITVSFDGRHEQTFDQSWWTTPFRSVKTDTESKSTVESTTTKHYSVPTKVRFKDAPLMHTLEYGNMKVLKINNERCSKAKDAPCSKSNAILLYHHNHFGVICDNMMFYDRGIVPEDIEAYNKSEAYNKRLKEGVRF